MSPSGRFITVIFRVLKAQLLSFYINKLNADSQSIFIIICLNYMFCITQKCTYLLQPLVIKLFLYACENFVSLLYLFYHVIFNSLMHS